jgi:hypothetical protein
MLPNRGKCHGVFILAHAAKLAGPTDLNDWIDAAKQRPSFLAGALNFESIASEMLEYGLVLMKEKIILDDSLSGLIQQADRWTLVQIARIILRCTRPVWLDLAVQNGKILREYIPDRDLSNLSWLSDELDEILLDVAEESSRAEDDERKKLIGDAAELLIFQSLSLNFETVRHVSKISDSFGYDIELANESIDRIEVKGTSVNHAGRFYISRNEYEKSLIFRFEWRVIQVLFDTSAYISEYVDISFVRDVRYLSFDLLTKFIPSDTENFRWDESAVIRIPWDNWLPVEFALDKNFKAKGFRVR